MEKLQKADSIFESKINELHDINIRTSDLIDYITGRVNKLVHFNEPSTDRSDKCEDHPDDFNNKLLNEIDIAKFNLDKLQYVFNHLNQII